MKFRSSFLNAILAIVVVVGCVFGVAHDRRLQMSQHPGAAALKRFVMEIVDDLGGPSSTEVEVLEKSNWVAATAGLALMDTAPRLGDIALDFEGRGFRLHRFAEGRHLTLCRDETVIEIDLPSPQAPNPRIAQIEASWGQGSVICAS